MTTTAADILARCRSAGVTLQADGGRLRFRPVDAVDPGLRAALLRHKAAILEALDDRPILCRQPNEWDASDRAAVDATLGLRPVWTPRPARTVPGIPDGWTAAAWVKRLTYMADVCQEIRPDLAERHRAEAQRIGEIENVPF